MTGYSKINRKKLPKHAYGKSLPKYEDGYDLVDNSRNQNAQHVNDSDSSSGLTSGQVGAGLNFLSSTVSGFNKGGTGEGSVALSGLSSGLSGAAAGTAVLPGIGTAVGGAIGLASGLIGGASKRNQLLNQQRQQQQAQARIAGQQSDQTLRQYDTQGVSGAQLYADGGDINGSPVIQPNPNNPPLSDTTRNRNKPDPTKEPTYNASLLTNGKFMVQKTDRTIGQWGNPIPTNTTIPTNTGSKSVVSPAIFNPSTFNNMQVGRNMNIAPSPNTIHRNGYALGGYPRRGKIGDPNVEYPNFPLYADGGELTQDNPDYLVNPEWEAEGGETVQGQDAQLEQSTPIASDIQQVDGPSHEQGGVQGSGGDRIYSNRLKISPELHTVLKTNGIRLSANSTYADVSNKLGRLKGKFEAKTDGVGKQTAGVMLPRLEQSLDDTFNDQEASKAEQSYKKFAKGGSLKKLADGGDPNPYSNLILPNTTVFNTEVGKQTPPGIDADVWKGLYGNSETHPSVDSNTNPENNSILGNVAKGIEDNSGQLANLGNYAANLGTINRLNTTSNPSFINTPNYNYVDRSGSAINRNSAMFRTGVKSLTNSGTTVNASNIGSLYAKTLESNSNIAEGENRRKDAYNDSYNQRADRVNLENTSIQNKSVDDARDLFNQKIALQLGARNAFQQGIQGNALTKQQNKLNQKKLSIIGLMNNQNGVTDRKKAVLKTVLSPDEYSTMFPNG